MIASSSADRHPAVERARYEFGEDSRAEQQQLVTEVLDSGQLGIFYGSKVRDWEQCAANYLGIGGAVAVTSGTAALELILRALGIGAGATVIVPEFCWVSDGGAIAATGAEVRVAPMTESLTPGLAGIEPLLTSDVAAVVVAHMRGAPAAELHAIVRALARRGIPLIEDCAQAWGVRVGVRHVGSFGRAAFFSTQAYKLIATGEGGLVASADQSLIRAVRVIQGDTRVHSEDPVWRLNHRLTELQASIAIPQIVRLDRLIARLRRLQELLAAVLEPVANVRRVVPDRAGRKHSNGTFLGAWFDSSAAAGAARDRLTRIGVPARIPASGSDLHFASAWPVRAERTRVDIAAYLDLPVPDLDPADHTEFADAVSAALAGRPQSSRATP
jgi:dTDP-4-amino-4,6-dideoxygalactose transaminase